MTPDLQCDHLQIPDLLPLFRTTSAILLSARLSVRVSFCFPCLHTNTPPSVPQRASRAPLTPRENLMVLLTELSLCSGSLPRYRTKSMLVLRHPRLFTRFPSCLLCNPHPVTQASCSRKSTRVHPMYAWASVLCMEHLSHLWVAIRCNQYFNIWLRRHLLQEALPETRALVFGAL